MAHRVLVVDDDPHIRDVISFALEKAGMTTETARDGGEALMSFRRHPPDMIILDIGMPDTDGLAVCREIRKSSNIPILFCRHATTRSTGSSGWRSAATTT